MSDEETQPGRRVAVKEEVRRLLARRYTQVQIAEHLGISQPAVSKWKKKIEEDARAAAVDRAAEIQRIIETLDDLEREAWEAWEKSKEPGVIEKSESGTGAKGLIDKDITTTKHQIGDTAYLAQVQDAIKQRRAILGLDAPTKNTGTVLNVTPEQLAQMSDDELNAFIGKLGALAGSG